MYSVKLDNQLLFDPRVEELVILDPQLSLEVNKVGGFDFMIPPTHPLSSSIEKHKTRIEVFQDDNLLFRGRVLDDELDFNNFKKVTCEGVLSFLHDSIIAPYEFQGGVVDYLTLLIQMHNERMESYDHKKFTLGNVTVLDPNDYIVRANRTYPTTWEEIEDKLLDILGGYIVLRIEDDVQYIDYLSDSDYVSSQKITFGENLLDIKHFTNGDDVATAIIPLGKADDEEETRLTIESVNNGKDFVYDATAVQIYGGYIFKKVEYPDVTQPQNLLARAYSDLEKAVRLGLTIELTALDMSMLDVNIDDFRLFQYVEVVSKPHNLNTLFLVTKLTVHLTQPEQNKLTVGKKITYLTSEQTQVTKSVSKLQSTIETTDATIKQVASETMDSVNEINKRTGNYWQIDNEDGGTPNMLAGNEDNNIPPTFEGSKIGGGSSNVVYANHGTISGGYDSTVTADNGTISGGRLNTIYGPSATISGGENGTVAASYGVIGGGKGGGVYGSYGLIAGGEGGNVTASHGVIVGGKSNQSNAPYATVVAGESNRSGYPYSTVINGKENSTNADYGTVINGNGNEANNIHSSVGNGKDNEANGPYSAILSGLNNSANNTGATVLNGENNHANLQYSTIVAGKDNQANGIGSAVLSGDNNMAFGEGSAVVGKSAAAYYPGSLAQGFGNFGTGTRAVSHRLKLIGTTTDDTKSVLGFNHTDEKFYCNNVVLTTYKFEYTVLAQSAAGVIKIWKVTALIGNVGAGLVFLNPLDKEVIHQSNVSAAAWDVAMTIWPEGGSSVEISVDVTGGNETVHWLADVDMLQLSLPNV